MPEFSKVWPSEGYIFMYFLPKSVQALCWASEPEAMTSGIAGYCSVDSLRFEPCCAWCALARNPPVIEFAFGTAPLVLRISTLRASSQHVGGGRIRRARKLRRVPLTLVQDAPVRPVDAWTVISLYSAGLASHPSLDQRRFASASSQIDNDAMPQTDMESMALGPFWSALQIVSVDGVEAVDAQGASSRSRPSRCFFVALHRWPPVPSSFSRSRRSSRSAGLRVLFRCSSRLPPRRSALRSLDAVQQHHSLLQRFGS